MALSTKDAKKFASMWLDVICRNEKEDPDYKTIAWQIAKGMNLPVDDELVVRIVRGLILLGSLEGLVEL